MDILDELNKLNELNNQDNHKLYDIDLNCYDLSSIKKYELIESKKQNGSLIARAGLGAFVLGPVGILAGITAKKEHKVLLFMDSGLKKVVILNDKEFNKLIEFI